MNGNKGWAEESVFFLSASHTAIILQIRLMSGSEIIFVCIQRVQTCPGADSAVNIICAQK